MFNFNDEYNLKKSPFSDEVIMKDFAKSNLESKALKTDSIFRQGRYFSKLLGSWAGAVFLLFVFIAPRVFADDQHKVETAFIYQFTNYIQWPSEVASENFVITVLGNSPIIEHLEELAKLKTVKGRKIAIHRALETQQIKKSEIVIITSADEKHLHEVTRKNREGGTLIITSSKGFAEKGAMINFIVNEGRLQFEINRSSLENAKLQISSQLLKLAKLVE